MPLEQTQPAGQSFRERTLQRLGSEGGAPPPLQSTRDRGADRPTEEPVARTADETEVPSAETEQVEQAPETPDAEPEEGEESESDPRITELQTEVERLSKREKELVADYTRKTQKIAESRRAIEHEAEQLQPIANFYANLAEQHMAPFQNVDWQALRATPEKYQQAAKQYQTAMTQAEQLRNTEAQLRKNHEELRDRMKREEATVSREILKIRISGWSNERFAEVREFAVAELGFTPEEVNDWTDWRYMSLAHRVWEIANASKVVTKVKAPGQKPPTPGRNAAPAPRGTSGKYESARQAAFNNPGQKGRFAAMKEAQLRKQMGAKRNF